LQADRSVGLEDAPDLTGIRVMIVEDDDDARALVAKVLEGQGARVEAVSVQPAELITVVARLATRRN
jgi:CheY-like chemotaxis protein